MSDVTIPEAVWDEARKAIMEAELHPAKPSQIRVVARAILAERERCAKIADACMLDIGDHPYDFGKTDAGGMRAAEKIAQAIRSSHE